MSGNIIWQKNLPSDGDVPVSGTSPSKKAENDGDVPLLGTSPSVERGQLQKRAKNEPNVPENGTIGAGRVGRAGGNVYL